MSERGSGASLRRLAVVLACAVLVGCGGEGRRPAAVSVPTPSDSVLDLTSEFENAAVHREVGALDLGTSQARPHLGKGWSHDEQSRLGLASVWATGSRSVVRFFVGEPRDIELKLTCWTLSVSTLGSQITAVTINDEPVGTLTISSNRGGMYRIAVPKAVLRAGENTLAFDFAWSARPVDILPGSDDRRLLSVMFDVIVFDGLVDAEAPDMVATGAAEYLRVPPRSSVSFFAEVPPNASLWLGRVTSERTAEEDACALEVGI